MRSIECPKEDSLIGLVRAYVFVSCKNGESTIKWHTTILSVSVRKACFDQSRGIDLLLVPIGNRSSSPLRWRIGECNPFYALEFVRVVLRGRGWLSFLVVFGRKRNGDYRGAGGHLSQIRITKVLCQGVKLQYYLPEVTKQLDNKQIMIKELNSKLIYVALRKNKFQVVLVNLSVLLLLSAVVYLFI
ncbi:uncharacterized protein LOC122008542 [Zingiber officinale]|uniref:uncharacterized protein LOC122008542 n=1 Tax=Zingiber officinale TaxID=94328 RepID=UPI001C4DBD6D|nr:uncharacterized protein LOC122008542 [Zingiber officinale]